MRGRDDAGIAEFDRHHPRQCRKERDHDRREIARWRRFERLHRDLDGDIDQDRREHRQRNQFDQIRQIAEHAAEAEE